VRKTELKEISEEAVSKANAKIEQIQEGKEAL